MRLCSSHALLLFVFKPILLLYGTKKARNFKKRFENKNRAQESDTAQVPLQEASHLDTFNRASARNAKHQVTVKRRKELMCGTAPRKLIDLAIGSCAFFAF
jgi:hypothetical protein